MAYPTSVSHLVNVLRDASSCGKHSPFTERSTIRCGPTLCGGTQSWKDMPSISVSVLDSSPVSKTYSIPPLRFLLISSGNDLLWR